MMFSQVLKYFYLMLNVYSVQRIPVIIIMKV